MYVCMYKLYFPTVKTWLQKITSPKLPVLKAEDSGQAEWLMDK